jgi:methylmalonyl-CoA mutase N-terminal domain/subunit
LDSKVRARLDELRTAIAKGKNLMPPLIKAVKALATLGEITNVLKDAFGEYQEHIAI